VHYNADANRRLFRCIVTLTLSGVSIQVLAYCFLPSDHVEGLGHDTTSPMLQPPTADDASLETISAALKRNSLNQDEAISLQDICMRCHLLRLEGKELVATRRYVEATRVYREAICVVMGKDFEVPDWSRNHGMIKEAYIKITDWQRIALMQCCNGIVQCRAMLHDLQGVRIELLLRDFQMM
jgi:hypothetical protein